MKAEWKDIAGVVKELGLDTVECIQKCALQNYFRLCIDIFSTMSAMKQAQRYDLLKLCITAHI